MASTITVDKWANQSITTVTVPAGETSIPIMIGCSEAVVALSPGGGGTMSASASWSTVEDIQRGAGNWQVWDAGTVSAPTTQSLYSATALRITATTQQGVAEVRQ